jgi:hypothetical protein
MAFNIYVLAYANVYDILSIYELKGVGILYFSVDAKQKLMVVVRYFTDV